VHPRLLQFGHLVLPTYGVILALGLIASLLICLQTARLLSLDKDKVWNLALLEIVVTIAAAKLLVAAVRWPQDGPRGFTFGLNRLPGALLCGIVIAIVACWWYASRTRLPFRRTADALAPAMALGSAAVSVACLESGCGFGTPSHVPWAVVYTSPFADPDTPLGVPLHPTQLYMSAMQFSLFVLLLWLLSRPHRDGEIIGAWLFLAGLSSFFLGFLRGDSGFEVLFGGVITLSQAIAATMVLLGGCLWLRRGEFLEASRAG
jgi:phosphatidylglycerol---prolipoprotein diacylglyceryl transferase